MIVEVSLYNGPQPFPELCHGQMSASSKLLLQRSQLGRESLADGLAQKEEFAGLPRLPTDVGETQEVERLRLPFSTLFSVCDCKAPELDQPRLVRVQL